VEDNLRVIRRGFDELREVPTLPDAGTDAEEVGEPVMGQIPTVLDVANARPGIGNPGRFWEQVCGLCRVGQDPIADPFAAISAMPAGTSTIRDMTDIRFEVPEFIPELCTGCSQCWVQCPDAAIPGLVSSVEDVIDTAIRAAANGRPLDRIKQVSKNLARESRKILQGVPFTTFGDVIASAYRNLVE
jgi:pyruvate-ferredoxin/flavodoxin oxidoreductase